ncbi:MAG: succinyl-diaminopimelate desuccinylase, partial [Gammaproteobacteria bacterium]|nr:succinyl-diaminopimelate desuccinylase [Gammaproteobacteria bacterium]
DVVPPGPETQWNTTPFSPELIDGYLYGRGAADMKGSIAAMVIALQRFVTANPDHPGRLALLLTSDEEGIAVNGTSRVIDHLQSQGESIHWCVVGEPTSDSQPGDIVKVGRRGSLTGVLKVTGIQGHVAYPDRARNPIHEILPALNEICNVNWDNGNEFYDPSSLQVSNFHAGTGADNMIPGEVQVRLNIRYCTETTESTIKKTIEKILGSYDLIYELSWLPSSKPFLTQSGDLITAVTDVIKAVTGRETKLSTSGGTSDGRFVAPTGAEVVEIGPVNKTIHKVNECVKVEDLDILSEIYYRIMETLLIK